MWPAPETFTQNDTLPNRVQDVFFHFTALTGLFVGVTNQWEDTDASKIIPHYNFSAREPIDPCHICDQSASTWQLLNLLFIVWEILRVLVSFQIRLTQRRILNSTCVSLTGCWIAHFRHFCDTEMPWYLFKFRLNPMQVACMYYLCNYTVKSGFLLAGICAKTYWATVTNSCGHSGDSFRSWVCYNHKSS